MLYKMLEKPIRILTLIVADEIVQATIPIARINISGFTPVLLPHFRL